MLAIVNPVSGRRKTPALLRELRRRLRSAGVALEVRSTAGPRDATRIAAEVGGDVDAVLVVGGDGTVREVIDGLAGRDTPVVIVPTGTANIVAREFGMQADAGAVARTLLEGTPVHVDVGQVNGRRFVIVVGVGFDAEVVERLTRRRRGHIGYVDYFWPLWQTFWSHRWPRLKIEADGVCVFDDRGLAMVGVLARYSLGLRILKHARTDDGLIDVCAMPCASRRRLLSHALNVLRGRHVDRCGVVYRQCCEVRITSPDRVPVEVDGDTAGSLPVICTVASDAAVLLTDPQHRT